MWHCHFHKWFISNLWQLSWLSNYILTSLVLRFIKFSCGYFCVFSLQKLLIESPLCCFKIFSVFLIFTSFLWIYFLLWDVHIRSMRYFKREELFIALVEIFSACYHLSTINIILSWFNFYSWKPFIVCSHLGTVGIVIWLSYSLVCFTVFTVITKLWLISWFFTCMWHSSSHFSLLLL